MSQFPVCQAWLVPQLQYCTVTKHATSANGGFYNRQGERNLFKMKLMLQYSHCLIQNFQRALIMFMFLKLNIK